jgi:hypothetical protein
LDDLRRAARFKRFITQEEIRSFPSSIDEEKNSNNQNTEEEKIRTIDFNDKSDLKLLGYSFVFYCNCIVFTWKFELKIKNFKISLVILN